MKLRKIYNKHIQDYLGEHGYFPEYEEDGYAFYKPSKRFRELMDKYTIEFICIPNKL